MKNLFKLSLVVGVFTGAFMNAQSLEESVAIIYNGSISVREGYAKTLEVKSFDDAVRYETSLAINLSDYTDDGKNNDKVAGDHIYTSVKTFKSNEIDKSIENAVFISDEFQHNKTLEEYLVATNKKPKNSIGANIGCKIVRVKSGKTLIFGDDCSKVWCIGLTDCTFEIGFSFEW